VTFLIQEVRDFMARPQPMKMGTTLLPWHYDAASPRAPIDKSAMVSDVALRLMLGSVPDFARSSAYPPTADLSINSVIDAMGHKATSTNTSWPFIGAHPQRQGLHLVLQAS
jgi:hypothetical protein